MATRLSLRSLWRIYNRTGIVAGTGGKRDLAITQLAFYSGARSVLKVLAHLMTLICRSPRTALRKASRLSVLTAARTIGPIGITATGFT